MGRRGELEQGAVPGAADRDAERGESPPQALVADRLTGAAPGEQPLLPAREGLREAEGGRVGRAPGREVAGQLVQRWGQQQGFAAEADGGAPVVGGDVAAAQRREAAHGLAVEQHQAAGEAVRRGHDTATDQASDTGDLLVGKYRTAV